MKRILLYSTLVLFIAAMIGMAFYYFKPTPIKTGVRSVPFAQLPGWKDTNTQKSFAAFQTSCKAFLKQDPAKTVGSEYISLQAGDWQPMCKEAMRITTLSNEEAKQFFQKWFTPVEFFRGKPLRGLFTGYYMPLLQGSLVKTAKYAVPIYAVPKDMVTLQLNLFDPTFKSRTLVGRVVGTKILPYYTRKEINQGSVKQNAEVIAWVSSKIDRSFLEIQGSGIIALPDGSRLVVGYAAQNGASYSSIAKVLIDKGVMTKHNASMQGIRSYLEAHPKEIDPVLNANKSFVFFQVLEREVALGAQGVALTPGYSLAIDRKWVPLGVPVWLNTTRPDLHSSHQKVFKRLMIAQDTGGAIRGHVRGDVYWGTGERATEIAGRMKNPGHYWLFLPRQAIERLQEKMVS